MTTTIGVIGAGSWGTALAMQLARNGARVPLWGRNAEVMAEMASTRLNRRYLPDTPLPDGVEPTADLEALLAESELLLLAVPSHAFRDTLQQIAPQLHDRRPLAWATKGLEPGCGKLLHQVVGEELGHDQPMAVISGPTFAGEVARNLPTAVTVAAHDTVIAGQFAQLLHGGHFRAYIGDDMIGVELGGAAKNVLAIAAGIADGIGYGANTRAALVTRGLAEIMRLGCAIGAKAETFMGLAGLGDLVLTCTDDQSRNRRVGLGLGRGKGLEAVIAEIGQAVEGVKSAPELRGLARHHLVEVPIIEQVYEVLYAGQSPQRAVEALLQRELRAENG